MYIYNKEILIVLLIINLASCVKNQDSNKPVDSNSAEKNVVKNKKSKIFNFEYDAKPVEYYYEDGSLKEKGKLLNDSIKVGLWSYYKNDKLKKQTEYVYVDNSEYVYEINSGYLNQFWLFDENEKIVGGSFYEINEIKEEYNVGDEVLIKIFTPFKYFSDLDSELFLLYSSKENFDKGFSNRQDINFDTIWNVEKSYPSKFKEADTKFNLLFAIEPEKVGSFRASGILIEQAKDLNDNDSIIRYREMFLEIGFKVKDTIK